MARDGDTIAAISTAPGRGGIGIVRVSGPDCARSRAGLLGRVPQPRHAELHRFVDASGETIDHGLALFFLLRTRSPAKTCSSCTATADRSSWICCCARVLELGARTAAAGEFTERAFLNGKLDLAQAEAVADLIDSGSAQAARAAVRSLHGEFSALVRELAERVLRASHVGRGCHRLSRRRKSTSWPTRACATDWRTWRGASPGWTTRPARGRCFATD